MKQKLSIISAKGKQGNIDKVEKVFEYFNDLSFEDKISILLAIKENDLFKKEIRNDIIASSNIKSYSTVYTMENGKLIKEKEDKFASEFKQYSDNTFDYDSVINEGTKE